MYRVNCCFALLLLMFVFFGCNKTPSEPSAEPATGSATPTLDIPSPTAEILAALGPENDIPIEHLLPNPIFVAVGKPKQLLASPVAVGNEWLVSEMMMQGLQLYQFNPNSIDRFVQSSGFPLAVPVNVPNPQDPNAPPQLRMIQIARRATIITFADSVDERTLLLSVLNVDPTVLETFKRSEGKNLYYDLTPPNIAIPQRLAIGLLDNRTAILVEGIEEDIKAVFAGAKPNSPVLDRLKHTPVHTNDLTVLTSLEGLPVSPEELDKMMEQLGQTGFLSPNVASVISRHLRALTLSLNVSAASGQPIISIYAEGRDEKGAEAIGDAIRGFIVNGQTTMATMNEDVKKTLPIPADLATALLNAMSVDVKETQVHAALHNVDALLPTVAEGIHIRQTALQREQTERQRMEQLFMLTDLCTAYYEKNQQFPMDILDAEGKPLLSWRVALLPLMGLEDLYNKFKLDEPWDGATNKELVNSMPMIFLPLASDVAPPKTIVRRFNSVGTPLSNRDLKVEDLKSPQTTLQFVAVSPNHAVEWTKPDPLEFNSDNIVDIVGNPLLGITFSRQVCLIPMLPENDPQFEKQRQDIEALIKGMPLDIEPPQQGTE